MRIDRSDIPGAIDTIMTTGQQYQNCIYTECSR